MRLALSAALLVLAIGSPVEASHGVSRTYCEDTILDFYIEENTRYGGDRMDDGICEMPLEANDHLVELHWSIGARGSMELTFRDDAGTRVAQAYCIIFYSLPWYCASSGAVSDFGFYAESQQINFRVRSDVPLTAYFQVGMNGSGVCWSWERCFFAYVASGTFHTHITSLHAR